MKKAVALVLALTILSGLVPQGAIFAHDQNTQLPVSDLVIQAAESGPNLPVNSYRFSLFWNRPAPGRTLQQESATYNADDIRATNYRVEYVNKTRTQPNLPNDYLLDAGRPNPVIYTKPFQPGCLYEVRVIPYHIHYFFTTNSSGTIRTDRQIEPTGADLASERRAMFLTDLIVDGYSLNNEITVTWSNPVWRGTGGNVNVVDSYRVSYRVIDSNNNPGPEVVIPVALTHPNLREIGGRWEFTFPIPASNTGWSYDVKVVPLIGGTPVHAIRNPISVGGVMYDVACRNGEYWKETPITVSPTLSYRVDGVDAIRLIWTSLRGVPGSNMIDRLDIEEWDVDSTYDDLYNDPQLLKRLGIIGRIAGSNTNVLGITSYRDELDDMNVPKAYRLAIYFAGESEARVRTNLVIYVPDLIDFEPYSPTVKKFDVDNEDVPSLLLWWLAFARQPYNAEEAAEIDPRFGKYIDKNVEYDVYVTDVYENLDILYNDSVPLFRSVTGLTADKEGSDPDPIYKLRSSITEYQALTATGVVTKKLEYNKSYYVMIVARRVPFGTQSTKAYGDFYLPYPGSLPVRPAMIAAPPLVACDPPQIGRDFITIEWDLKYIEMYDPKTDDWYAVAGPSAAGPVFGRSAMDLSGKESILNNRVDPGRTWIPDYNSENPSAADLANFNAARDILAAQLNMSAGDVELRIIDLSKASYEIHTVEYTHMMAQGGYETYRRNNLDETFIPASANNWSPLSGPLGEGSKRGMVSYVVRSFNAPGSGALKENTAYVIYLRPYVNDAGVKVAYLPNYVMATTLESKPELDVKPVAPALEPVSETDDTLTVRWKMLRNQDNIPYEYDLQYTERLTNGGTVWYALNWDFIKDDVLIRTVGSDEYMYYTITKLFPDTLYNIRIMARYPTASKQQSEWSNPIEMRTLDITAPNPPQGLGLAGRDHISEYNRLNGTDYSPSEQNALNISWMRDGLDDKPAAGAGNATGGSAELLPLDEIKDFLYMVRFEGLLPNRSYYIRAKTIKTVSRSGPGAPSDTAYSYVVQVAQTDEFLDCIEFVIPPVARQGDISETNVKQKESGWSTAIRLVTSRTDEEYDGDVNPDHYPLP
ncbi:MAG: fibronectin type III domain-containing protein, partial [Defluviitaleaceae bacterium]|nr:fibronectin type III domain-containing protein [Defluviitaleaceae bacterium]